MERKLVANIGKKYINPEEDFDVRLTLKKCFLVGASVQEACDYAGVHISVYKDWEYTWEEINKIKEYMYINKLSSYLDIKDDGSNIDINVELLKHLKKNPKFGDDVFKLITTCKKAQAEVVIYHLSNIHNPKKGGKAVDWKSSAWFLERTNPERYGKDTKGDKEEKVVEKISVEFVGSDSQESVDRLKELEKEVKESLNIVDEN